MADGRICVCVRMRALIERELRDCHVHWRCDNDAVVQQDPVSQRALSGGGSYSFDRVYDHQACNTTVYDGSVRELVAAAMAGFNVTVLAYGQTSSGKTHTMTGSAGDPGIVPRVVNQVFDTIELTPDREYLLRVSYMEIYREEVSDMIAVDSSRAGKALRIHEDTNGQVSVSELREVCVNCATSVMQLMRQGDVRRHVGITNMNERSSRSHTIFRIIIESRVRESVCGSGADEKDGAVTVSHINLVDLAGSERARQTGATGDRFREGCSINSSLFELGNVISKLSEGAPFISYRNSKLTRILQSSLGGNAKTAIICTVTPAAVEETHSTLRFASRAKTVQNKPRVNEVLSDSAHLRRMAREMSSLQQQLEQQRAANSQCDQALAEQSKRNEELQCRLRHLTEQLVVSSAGVHLHQPAVVSSKSEGYKRRRTWCGRVGGALARAGTSALSPTLLLSSTASSEQMHVESSAVSLISDVAASPERLPASRQRRRAVSVDGDYQASLLTRVDAATQTDHCQAECQGGMKRHMDCDTVAVKRHRSTIDDLELDSRSGSGIDRRLFRSALSTLPEAAQENDDDCPVEGEEAHLSPIKRSADCQQLKREADELEKQLQLKDELIERLQRDSTDSKAEADRLRDECGALSSQLAHHNTHSSIVISAKIDELQEKDWFIGTLQGKYLSSQRDYLRLEDRYVQTCEEMSLYRQRCTSAEQFAAQTANKLQQECSNLRGEIARRDSRLQQVVDDVERLLVRVVGTTVGAADSESPGDAEHLESRLAHMLHVWRQHNETVTRRCQHLCSMTNSKQSAQAHTTDKTVASSSANHLMETSQPDNCISNMFLEESTADFSVISSVADDADSVNNTTHSLHSLADVSPTSANDCLLDQSPCQHPLDVTTPQGLADNDGEHDVAHLLVEVARLRQLCDSQAAVIKQHSETALNTSATSTGHLTELALSQDVLESDDQSCPADQQTTVTDTTLPVCDIVATQCDTHTENTPHSTTSTETLNSTSADGDLMPPPAAPMSCAAPVVGPSSHAALLDESCGMDVTVSGLTLSMCAVGGASVGGGVSLFDELNSLNRRSVGRLVDLTATSPVPTACHDASVHSPPAPAAPVDVTVSSRLDNTCAPDDSVCVNTPVRQATASSQLNSTALQSELAAELASVYLQLNQLHSQLSVGSCRQQQALVLDLQQRLASETERVQQLAALLDEKAQLIEQLQQQQQEPPAPSSSSSAVEHGDDWQRHQLEMSVNDLVGRERCLLNESNVVAGTASHNNNSVLSQSGRRVARVSPHQQLSPSRDADIDESTAQPAHDTRECHTQCDDSVALEVTLHDDQLLCLRRQLNKMQAELCNERDVSAGLRALTADCFSNNEQLRQTTAAVEQQLAETQAQLAGTRKQLQLMSEMREQLHKITLERDRLQRTLVDAEEADRVAAGLEQKVRQMEEERENTERDCRLARSAEQQALSQLSEATASVKQLSERLSSDEERLRCVRVELHDARARIDSSAAVEKQLTDDLRASQLLVEQLRASSQTSDNPSCDHTLLDHQAELPAGPMASAALHQARCEINDLRDQLQTHEAELARMTERCGRLSDQLTTERREAADKVSQLVFDVDEREVMLTDAQQTAQQLTDRVSELEASAREQLRASELSWQQRLDELQQRAEQEKHQALKEFVEGSRSNTLFLQKHIEDADNELAEARDQLSASQSECEQLQQQLLTATDKLQQLNTQLMAALSDKQLAEEQKRKATQQHDERVSELEASAREQLRASELSWQQRLDELQQRAEQEKHQALKEFVEGSRSNTLFLQKHIEDADNELTEARDQLTASQSECQRLQKQLLTATDKLKQLKTQLVTALSDKQLAEEQKELQKRVSELQENVAQAQTCNEKLNVELQQRKAAQQACCLCSERDPAAMTGMTSSSTAAGSAVTSCAGGGVVASVLIAELRRAVQRLQQQMQVERRHKDKYREVAKLYKLRHLDAERKISLLSVQSTSNTKLSVTSAVIDKENSASTDTDTDTDCKL